MATTQQPSSSNLGFLFAGAACITAGLAVAFEHVAHGAFAVIMGGIGGLLGFVAITTSVGEFKARSPKRGALMALGGVVAMALAMFALSNA